ncbi:MAG: glucans biosynthesis glucosyltransferase MdoH [Desulfovibrio sp.]|uniref:glucans biosynthesis glucosyltransferase MdoH n=1 Tax=Desulfovibrio sp. 7SRBS1 TaxID=3378064 RepID=UPI003B3CA41B
MSHSRSNASYVTPPETPYKKPWKRSLRKRRALLTLLIVVPAAAAAAYVGSVLPHQGGTPLETAIVLVYSILFAWISVGFWTALMGGLSLLRRYDRFAVSRATLGAEPGDIPPARTAVLFPICNEETPRVMAGIKATYLSLLETGRASEFAIFILSDSHGPDKWLEEEAAWAELVRELGAQEQIFYRRRKVNLKRKSGNVADFCRRHGADYEYMAVFDADSVMKGATLTRMVDIMQRRPDVGILQTAPSCFGRDTFLGRVQQFANRVYGPMFAAGLHFWQFNDAQYWGHNALIRIKPFMEHCGLPRLPGKPPLGGDILSHDFVEAALMRRAGWGVWLAFDLDGSWEEAPPNLLAELKRDRRWCQGNLQHLRLLFTEGLFPAHRVLFLNGAMSYASALLWFLFLALSTAEALLLALSEPVYFSATKSLFPVWPVWEPMWAMALLGTTAVLLFFPKILSYLLLVCKTRQSRHFGGPIRLFLSILLEVVVSAFLAPIRMLSHSKFVFITMLGRQIGWGSQQRDDSSTTWGDALRYHGGSMFFGLLWGGSTWVYAPTFFWWISPIVLPVVLSAPISVITSRRSIGLWLRRHKMLLIPEETVPEKEIRDVTAFAQELENMPVPLGMVREHGFARAVVDPGLNALHCRGLGTERSLAPAIAEQRDRLVERALQKGPDALGSEEKLVLLGDPARMRTLHREVWGLPEVELVRQWGVRF